MPLKTSAIFINELINTFPEIKEDVLDQDWTGLINLQVGCFCRYTQKAIDTNNKLMSVKCFNFVEDIFKEVVFEVENAIGDVLDQSLKLYRKRKRVC